MNTLELITEGLVKIPDLMLVYGPDGVGKSTFASKAPDPIFLDVEKSTRRIKTKRYDKAQTFGDVLQFIGDLTNQAHTYKTFVLDSVTEFERMIWRQMCLDQGVLNIEEVGGGFNKGYVVALTYWEQLKRALTELQARRDMGIIMLGHAEMKTFQDPISNTSYDRYQIGLDKRAAKFLREWVDMVGFANYVTYTKGKENALKQKAYGDGIRKLYTERRPAYDAKNRLGLPLAMEFEYEAYAAFANADEGIKAKQVVENIEEMLKDTTDEELKVKVRDTVAKAGDNVANLMIVQERLRNKLQEKENLNAASK